MGKKTDINVEKTAKLIGKTTQFVRLGLQQGRLPFGSAVQKPNGRWSYDIVEVRVYQYLGKEKEEEVNENNK